MLSTRGFSQIQLLIFFGVLLVAGATLVILFRGPQELPIIAVATSTPSHVDESASTSTISIFPSPTIVQGEPFLIVFDGAVSTSSIRNATFNGKPFSIFSYNGKISGLAGVDLGQKPGEYVVRAEWLDESSMITDSGNLRPTVITKTITVKLRPKVEAPLGIPEKLGGNTPESQTQLVTTLASEGAELHALIGQRQVLWNSSFIFPISNPFVTDTYGYSRQTGNYSIAHKGTDFRAAEGTPVHAMNDGVVLLTKEFRNYGRTVVIDHGGGLFTLYLHTSKFLVEEGQMVQKGDIIALSGSTGYAESPHLHVSVWIDGISIDPLKFLELVH